MRWLWLALGVVLFLALAVVIIAVVVLVMNRPASTVSSAPNTNASTPTNSSTPSTTDVEREIERINNEVGTAMVNNDPDTLGRLLADDYRYVSDVGLTLSKMEVLVLIRTGNLSYEYLTTTNPKVEVIANKAILTAQAQSKGQLRRQPFTDSYSYRNTYEQRGSGWQLVSAVAWHPR
jgi:hypothetical protein